MNHRTFCSVLAVASLAATAHAQIFSDLSPTYFRWSSALIPGNKVQVTSKIKNVGIQRSNGTFSGYYLSTNASFDSRDRLLATFTIPALNPGVTATHNWNWTVSRDIPAGTCYFGVWADNRNRNPEFNEANNQLSFRATCLGLPNLRISRFSSSSTRVEPGQQVSLRTTNLNDGGTHASAFRTGYYFSTDSMLSTSDRLLAWSNSAGLFQGRAVDRVTSATIPRDAPLGDRYLGAIIDDQRRIRESVETDNTKAVKIRCFRRGAFATYGTACDGKRGKSHHSATNPNGAPYIGTRTTYRLTNGPRNFLSIFSLGTSRTKYHTLSLPLKLDAFGALGCTLLASSEIRLTVGTNERGDGSISLTHPNVPRFVGRSFYTQFMNLEPSINRLGLTFSNAVVTTLGQL